MLGKKIVPIISDGKSNWSHFAKEAERLIVEEKVSVIFGCWTSACRKTIKPIIEKHNHLLFYPIQYEGLEQSPNIIYTGATPNQQIIPAVKWAFENLGKKFFLIGSDYIFPRTANFIIKDQLKILGGEVLGEEYVSLGSTQFEKTIEKIRQTKPDVILNTINGDSNIAFFQNRLRTKKTRACVSRTTILTMVYKLGLSAEKGWRKLRGFRRLADVINGIKFIDGVDEETFERQRNAA